MVIDEKNEVHITGILIRLNETFYGGRLFFKIVIATQFTSYNLNNHVRGPWDKLHAKLDVSTPYGFRDKYLQLSKDFHLCFFTYVAITPRGLTGIKFY